MDQDAREDAQEEADVVLPACSGACVAPGLLLLPWPLVPLCLASVGARSNCVNRLGMVLSGDVLFSTRSCLTYGWGA